MENNKQLKFIKYKDTEIQYIIDKSKRKNVYITVKNGIAYIKITNKMTNNDGHKILENNIEWIYIKYKEAINKINMNFKIENGTKIILFGKEYTICLLYVDNYIEKMRKNVIINEKSDRLEFYILKKLNDNIENILEIELENYKKQKLEKCISKLSVEIENKMRLKPKKYRIRKLKNAWGTCSTTKNISINIDLIKFNENIIRYVLIHEIAHLKYMNHSKEFWNLVSLFDKNYKENREKLKKEIYY